MVASLFLFLTLVAIVASRDRTACLCYPSRKPLLGLSVPKAAMEAALLKPAGEAMYSEHGPISV